MSETNPATQVNWLDVLKARQTEASQAQPEPSSGSATTPVTAAGATDPAAVQAIVDEAVAQALEAYIASQAAAVPGPQPPAPALDQQAIVAEAVAKALAGLSGAPTVAGAQTTPQPAQGDGEPPAAQVWPSMPHGV